MITKFKKSVVLVITFLFVSFSTMAQDGFRVSSGNRILNGIDSTVFVLEVDRAIEKDVLKAWKKAVEKSKAKAAVSNNELSITGVIIESLSTDSTDIYSTVVQQDKSVKLYTTFIVNKQRVNPKGKEGLSVKCRMLLNNFGSRVYKEVLERELEEKKEELKELNKLRDKNLKTQDKITKAIQKDSLQIGVEETEIALLKGQLQNATDRYTAQKAKISSGNYSNKDDLKAAKEELKGYDKERKNLDKEIQKHSNEILDLKSEIRDNQHELKQLITEHQHIEEKILNQHGVVKAAEEELRVYPEVK